MTNLITEYLDKLNSNMDKSLSKYLKKLNESGAIFLAMFALTRIMIGIFLRIFTKIKTKKIEKGYSNKLFELTKKRYIVVCLQDDIPNAFCFHKFKQAIYITTGLKKLLKNNEREIMAVLLHESSHVINYDVLKNSSFMGGSLWIGSTLLAGAEKALYKKNLNPFQLSFFAAILVLLFLSSISRKIGRKAETKADVYTVKFGYSKDLIKVLKKIEKYNEMEIRKLEKDNPSARKQYEELKKFDEHPETKDRIKKLLDESELYKAIILKDMRKVKLITYKIILGSKDLQSETS